MVQLNGEKCPVCGKPFAEKDDIVFCPDCGTPHHRECYQKTGHCINEEKHKQGYTYQAAPPPSSAQENTKEEQPGEKVVCMACGQENPAQDIFCEKCGTPLHPGRAPFTAQQGPMAGGAGVTMFGEFLKPDEEFDGVKAKDWATYIGQAAPYYLSFFKHRKERNGKGVHFVFSALIFGPYYFLYRKMWLVGGLLLALLTLLEIPGVPVMMASFQMLEIAPEVLSILMKVQFVCTMVSLAVKLIASFFAIEWYQKYGAAQIKKLKEKAGSETEFQKELMRRSGPSKAVLYIGVGLLLLNSFANMWLIGLGL